MNKAQHLLARAGGVALGLAAPLITFAQSRENPFNRSQNLLNNTRTASGVTGGSDLPTIIGSLINVVLGFLGIVLLLRVACWFSLDDGWWRRKTSQNRKDMIRDAVIGPSSSSPGSPFRTSSFNSSFRSLRPSRTFLSPRSELQKHLLGAFVCERGRYSDRR